MYQYPHSPLPQSRNFIDSNHWNFQKQIKSIKHGSTGSQKQVPKTASIECCARPPVPQVMKVCFTLVLGHRYETCTLVFYRGVFLKKTLAQSALMPHYSIEKMVSKKTCAPPFYRGCFAGGACTPTIYIYKMGGHQCTPWIHRGMFFFPTPIWGRFPIWLIFFKGVENHQLN